MTCHVSCTAVQRNMVILHSKSQLHCLIILILQQPFVIFRNLLSVHTEKVFGICCLCMQQNKQNGASEGSIYCHIVMQWSLPGLCSSSAGPWHLSFDLGYFFAGHPAQSTGLPSISTRDKTLSFFLEVKGSNITEVSFNLLNLRCRLFSQARQNYWFPVNWMRNSKMEDCFVSVFLLFLSQIPPTNFSQPNRKTLF